MIPVPAGAVRKLSLRELLQHQPFLQVTSRNYCVDPSNHVFFKSTNPIHRHIHSHVMKHLELHNNKNNTLLQTR